VQQVVARYQVHIKRKQQRLDFTAAQVLPPVNGDRIHLARALTCVLTNAHDYTAEQGVIAVRTFCEDGYVVVEVADTGCGISRADLPHIFKRFYRADKARSTLTGGVGLGLSITKRIIEGHQGMINVESEEGRGSVFRLCLPVDSAVVEC
jgi:signal transduction histidine kinase